MVGVETVAGGRAVLVAAPVVDLEAAVDGTHTVLGAGGILVLAAVSGAGGYMTDKPAAAAVEQLKKAGRDTERIQKVIPSREVEC